MERKGQYELTFWGGIKARYKRFHDTLESAQNEARKILNRMENSKAHPAVIYGPDNAEFSVR